jgi:hypothetical protein
VGLIGWLERGKGFEPFRHGFVADGIHDALAVIEMIHGDTKEGRNKGHPQIEV